MAQSSSFSVPKRQIKSKLRLLMKTDVSEHYRKWGRNWYEKNKQRNLEQSRKWHQANPKRAVEVVQAYVVRNKEKVAAYNKQFSQTPEGKYRLLRHRHARRGWQDTLLSFDEYRPLYVLPCRYCGNPTRGGLDRVDNTHGYNLNNVVPCCELCNHMKWKLAQSDFLQHVGAIIAHQLQKPYGN